MFMSDRAAQEIGQALNEASAVPRIKKLVAALKKAASDAEYEIKKLETGKLKAEPDPEKAFLTKYLPDVLRPALTALRTMAQSGVGIKVEATGEAEALWDQLDEMMAGDAMGDTSKGQYNTQGAEHAYDQLVGIIVSMERNWRNMRGELDYYTVGHGLDQTPPKVRPQLQKTMSILEKFFDSEASFRGSGVLPKALATLSKLKKIK